MKDRGYDAVDESAAIGRVSGKVEATAVEVQNARSETNRRDVPTRASTRG